MKKMSFYYTEEQDKTDFNLFEIPTSLIPDLQKALQSELFLRSSKVNFAADRAHAQDNVGQQYSLKLAGSHVEFDG